MTRGKRGGGSGNNFKKKTPTKSKSKAWVDAPKGWKPQGDYTGIGDGGKGKYPTTTKKKDLVKGDGKGNGYDWEAGLKGASEVAGHMADKHKEANAGLSSSSAYGNFGAGQSYDTRPHTATRKLNKETDNWEY